MRATPLGSDAVPRSDLALARTDTPHMAPRRSGLNDAPAGANAAGKAPRGTTGRP